VLLVRKKGNAILTKLEKIIKVPRQTRKFTAWDFPGD
jgi:hypothetical protein